METLYSLLTFDELCRLFGTGKTAMYAAIKRGEIPPGIKIGRSWKWYRPTVEEWLEGREQPVRIDPVYSERAQKAVASREFKNSGTKNDNRKFRRRGRPTKIEQIEGNNT